jgi:hypothetical protein
MTEMEGAGRISAYKLYHDLFPFSEGAATIVVPELDNLGKEIMPLFSWYKEVDKTGATYLGLLDEIIMIHQVLNNDLSDFPRRVPLFSGKGHCQISGEMSMIGVMRNLNDKLRNGCLFKMTLPEAQTQGILKNRG